VQIAAPEKVTPRQRIEVPIRVANAQGRRPIVTLAAVDEGILQLTSSRRPSRPTIYFGKRRLGVDMRDDYGRLLDAAPRISAASAPAATRRHRRPRPRADAHRRAVQRAGEARRQGRGQDRARYPRLHRPAAADGVAYDKSKVGSSDARLFVRDAVTADVILPRFLAPDDQGRVALSLHNVDGQPGDYR
jgi:uncharacterized protein YfaS (alpha-2-macroglobulin family)